MRLAQHHIEGTPEHRLSGLLYSEVAFAPGCAWPDDCTVQWGHGIIPAVPFFEAFLPGTFIRGEGESIAEAEEHAFAQFKRQGACNHHWGRWRPKRETYLNGAGWCQKCMAFRSKMFNEVVLLGHWRKPLSSWEADHLRSMETDHALSAIMDRKYPGDAQGRRVRARVLRLRYNLFGALSPPPKEHPTMEEGL